MVFEFLSAATTLPTGIFHSFLQTNLPALFLFYEPYTKCKRALCDLQHLKSTIEGNLTKLDH